MRQRWLSYTLIWSSFYEQLAWTPVVIVLAANLGDTGVMAMTAAAYSLANLFGNLVFGMLSDRLGRYRVAGAGMLGMAATAYLHLVAGFPGMLVGARFLHGLTAGAVAPAALASVTEGVPASRRGEAMARVGLIIAVASMISPPISGQLTEAFGPTVAVGALVVAMALVGSVTILWGANHAAGNAHKTPGARGYRTGAGLETMVRAESEALPRTGLNLSLALIAAVVAFVLMFGQNVLFYALPLKSSQLGYAPSTIGQLLSAFAVGAALAFLPPLSRVSDRRGRRLPLLVGLSLTSLSLLTLGWESSKGEMALSLFCYGLGFGLVFAAVSALNADAAGDQKRGLAFGLLTAAFSLGSIAGPVVTGLMIEVAPPFVVSGIVAAIGAVAVAILYQRGGPALLPAGRGT